MSKLCEAVIGERRITVHCAGTWFGIKNLNNPLLWYWDENTHWVQAPARTYPDQPMDCYGAGHGTRQLFEPERYLEIPYGQVSIASGHDDCAKWLARHAVRDTVKSPYIISLMDCFRKPKKTAGRSSKIDLATTNGLSSPSG